MAGVRCLALCTMVVPLMAAVANPHAIANDESAFAISRNNGETWNQISLHRHHHRLVQRRRRCTRLHHHLPGFGQPQHWRMPASATSSTAYGAPPSIPTWLHRFPRFRRWAPTGSAYSRTPPPAPATLLRPTCPSCASSRPAPTSRTARSSAGPLRTPLANSHQQGRRDGLVARLRRLLGHGHTQVRCTGLRL